MKILIVEDETAAYESLVALLTELDSSIQMVGNTESVMQTVRWLQENTEPDLILMDINLSDGSSFLIFDYINIDTPIIFTTAYDEYAIDAFKVNSVDYLLKPIKEDELQRALDKYSKLNKTDIAGYLSKIAQLSPTKVYKETILVPVKDKLMPVDIRQVAYFYTANKNTIIQLLNGEQYGYSKSLDQIVNALDHNLFYRANKQFVVARQAIRDITIWFDSRLLINLDVAVPERIYVSKNKAAAFKEWMVNG